ncbi:PAS domain-containing protein [Hymenobacter daecheongensis]|uniref:PAS domain-containing protein n=1 Tax=Hymenobacter daecheongensis TaxID=496053 RepID=UPI00135648C0|nr:PAS domain-containing protein [Hymenobacter daecheongensis]
MSLHSLPADELLRHVTDVSLAAVQLWRPLYAEGGTLFDFALEYLNPAGQRMLGLPARPGGTMLGRFPHAGPSGTFDFYRQVYESGEPGRLDLNYQADGLDDYYRLAATRCGPLLVVSFTDTSDYEPGAVEQALRESQARERLALADTLRQRRRLLSVFEQVPALVARVNGPDLVLELANAALREAFPGTPPLLGRTVAEALPELANSPLLAHLHSVFRTGVPYHGTALPTRTAAGARYFDVVCQPSHDADGLTAGVFVFAYDVTAQVEARRALQTLNESLEAQVLERTNAALANQATALAAAHRQVQEREAFYRIFEQSPALILLLREPGHRIEYHNPAFHHAFAGRELLGRSFSEALPELVQLGVGTRLTAAFTEGLPAVDAELSLPDLTDPAAPPRFYTFTYQAYREGDQIMGVTVFGTDVTEQVRARQEQAISQRQTATLAEELLLANQRLIRTNADLNAFTYTASHDLGAPLANLQGLFLALREELPPAVQREEAVAPLLRLMQGALDRFQRTLADLTDVIRDDAELQQPAETVDLAALLTDVQLDLQPLLAETQPALTLDVAGCPRLWFAPGHLRSICYNLLSNALKYRDPVRPLQVQLTCRCEATAVVLEVCDNGLGVSAEQQARLFGLFQRLHPQVPGSGVGLYSVKKVVDNAGGSIRVRSEVGEGTCFTIYLPRHMAEVPAVS